MKAGDLTNALQAICHTGHTDSDVVIVDKRAKNEQGVSKIVFRDITSITINDDSKVEITLDEVE